MIHDLFKIGIYAEQLPLNNEELKKYCFDIKQKQDGVSISNRGGFHSENLDKNDENIKELMEEISSHANLYSEKIAYGEVGFSNIWCNINSYKDFKSIALPSSFKSIGGLLC